MSASQLFADLRWHDVEGPQGVRSSPRPCSASRHKRPFEQSPPNGRLASESCHWRGVASPGGHNIITMRPRPLVVLGNGVERCLGLPERELKILVTVPSPRRMGHVRVPQSSWRVLTWRPRQWWLPGGGDPVLDGAFGQVSRAGILTGAEAHRPSTMARRDNAPAQSILRTDACRPRVMRARHQRRGECQTATGSRASP